MVGFKLGEFINTRKKHIYKKKKQFMGQKIIPISLRLNKNQNWHSKWTVDTKEYGHLLHFDLEIRKYFETIFLISQLIYFWYLQT